MLAGELVAQSLSCLLTRAKGSGCHTPTAFGDSPLSARVPESNMTSGLRSPMNRRLPGEEEALGGCRDSLITLGVGSLWYTVESLCPGCSLGKALTT